MLQSRVSVSLGGRLSSEYGFQAELVFKINVDSMQGLPVVRLNYRKLL